MRGLVGPRSGCDGDRLAGGGSLLNVFVGTVRVGVADAVVEEKSRPGGGDVEERTEEESDLAVGSKGLEGCAERLEVILELRAVPWFEGVEPAAAGEEPVACMTDWGRRQRIRRAPKSRIWVQSQAIFLLRRLACGHGMRATKNGIENNSSYLESGFLLDRMH